MANNRKTSRQHFISKHFFPLLLQIFISILIQRYRYINNWQVPSLTYTLMHSKFIFILQFYIHSRRLKSSACICMSALTISDILYLSSSYPLPSRIQQKRKVFMLWMCLFVSYSVEYKFLYFESVFEGKYVGLKARTHKKSCINAKYFRKFIEKRKKF